jgi:hypothetical protein
VDSTTKTDRTTLNSKPNIIIHDNGKGTYLLTEIVILGNRNVIKKETEKVLTYGFITVETQRMWNLKMIPVIIGATGTVSESFRIYLINVPGNTSRNCRKRPYRALCAYFGKSHCTVTKCLSWELILRVPYIVTT